MDVESQIDPAFCDAPRPIGQIGQIVQALRSSATVGDLSWALEEYFAVDARARFADGLSVVEQHLAHGDVEAAWYALLRSAEFVGYCRGVAASRFEAQDEVRLRDVAKAKKANEARRNKTQEQNTSIIDALLALPDNSPVWKHWSTLDGEIRSQISAHPAKIRDTIGRVEAIRQDHRLAKKVKTLQPPARRKPNRKAPPSYWK